MKVNTEMSKSGTKKRRQRDTRVVSGRVSPRMFEEVNKIVESGDYVDMTDYLRDMIRKDLRERKINES